MNVLNYLPLLNILYALGSVIVGYYIAKKVSSLAEHAVNKRFSPHQAMLTQRLMFHILFALFLINAALELGFNLKILLGTAGILTVAIGFASQTAASNLISGLFLLFEHPFRIGDTIDVKGIIGTVVSIDLLSTKLRSSDGKLVRIPNETMIKSEIKNLSYFPTRCAEIVIGVAYSCNITFIKSILLDIAKQCENVLADPEPKVIINNFTSSAVELKLQAWVKNDLLGTTKDYLQEAIKTRFDQEGIEIPLPQWMIHQN
ncbi:mechanosensitive ion channel MscS [Legionella beliardensis]|uniref:Small-conductance mechanosensitive channel n=1 Tax=Legionella beliardensis TaxID=91822 RepID=A0A378I019_9GAMM|nr:mechanosensitive ion channel family protein [Legionella beliardensis]STX28333.1 mechanosensitive ion channel MscS [Legionella beliardensis]